MNRSRHNRLLPDKQIERIICTLAAHPYLSAFCVCLLLNPFYFGAAACVPQNSLMLTALLMLSVSVLLLFRAKHCGIIHRRIMPFLLLAVVCTCSVSALLYWSPWTGVWLPVMGVAVLLLWGLVFHCKHLRTQTTALLILCLSFLLKVYYVLYTPVYLRQHDVGTFGTGEDHAGYIEYLLYHLHLPDFDPRERWQFYHPPLHHSISALWIGLSENVFGVGYDAARESLQTLTLFYAMAIVITAYRILRHFHLKGIALFAPLVLIAFHPAYILLSGSINNDALSVVFIMGAVLCTLRWAKKQTWRDTIKLALCIGLGMMTKLSVGMIAFPVGLVMLVKLIQQLKRREWQLLKKLGIFAVICAPLGLWYPVRNYLRFGVPLNYVAQLTAENSQYIEDRSFWSRITDFSAAQFESVFEQFARRGTYNEFNPLTALLKNALFGEFIRERNFTAYPVMFGVTGVFFWLGVLLAAAAFVCMVVLLFRKCALCPLEKAFFGVFWLTLMVSFYQMSAQYPFVCTMNSRYVTPVIFIGALFYGAAMQKLTEGKRLAGGVLVKVMAVLPMLFAALATVTYVYVCSE